MITFAGVGAPKTGTTAVFLWLSSHPEVHMPKTKELHYFDGGPNSSRGMDWYRDQFADGDVDRVRQIGEWATTYLAHPSAIARMAQEWPDIKLVVSVREPVARAWSAYQYGISRFFLAGSFADNINAELGDLASGRERASGLITDGLYARHLERAFQYVPQERVHVLRHDSLLVDPAATFAALCRFLEIDDSWLPPDLGQSYNTTHTFRSRRVHMTLTRFGLYKSTLAPLLKPIARANLARGYPSLPARQREALGHVFALENARLAELLDSPLDGWVPSFPATSRGVASV